MNKIALSYDDINLIPSFSNIKSRKDINLRTLVSKRYVILVPLVAAPMDTVCEEEMAFKMFTLGGVGCIHRFMETEKQVEIVRNLKKRINESGSILDMWHYEIRRIPIMSAIGIHIDDQRRAIDLVDAGTNIIVIDVAHGHHNNVINMIKWCKENLPKHVDIIAGNIVTSQAAIDLENAGVDGLRCGVGNGSLCTTRIKTGFGVPTVTALIDVLSVAKVPVMADGGIRTSGDIAKALALGASTVMLGSLLAGTEESPGKIIERPDGLYKRYRGSASLETKTIHGQEERNVEGESTVIPFKGGTKFIVDGLIDGVRSALSYGGANNLEEFHPDYVQVTNSGIIEARPHLLK